MSLHAAAFAARGQPTVFQGERVRAFHTALAKQAAMDGSLWLTTLKTGGVPLAAFYGFRWKGVLHHFQSGVDPARRSFGPGNVLRSIALEEDVFGAGLVDYDFMDGDEAYKSGWTDGARALRRRRREADVGGRTRSLRAFAGLARRGSPPCAAPARTPRREKATRAPTPTPKETPPPAPPAMTDEGASKA
jgi:CelD/BcsL family acetyltransferase involved in cellulose biosynthesis